jgi:Putative lumazine-binding
MSELTRRTNEADVAAITEVVIAYYDGMVTGDEAKLARAFHPRACIVGNYQGQLAWQTLEEFVAECKEAAGDAGAHEWRIDGLSLQGDTALVRLGCQFAGDWYSDDLSMLRIDGVWRIVHKTWYVHPVAAAGTP